MKSLKLYVATAVAGGSLLVAFAAIPARADLQKNYMINNVTGTADTGVENNVGPYDPSINVVQPPIAIIDHTQAPPPPTRIRVGAPSSHRYYHLNPPTTTESISRYW